MDISLETLADKGVGGEVIDRVSALKGSTETIGLYLPDGFFFSPLRLKWEGSQLISQSLMYIHCITKREKADTSEIFHTILQSGFQMSETTKDTKRLHNVYVKAQDLSGQAYDVFWARSSLKDETRYDRFILEISRGVLAPWTIEKQSLLFHIGEWAGAGLLSAPADAVTGVIAVSDALSEEQFSQREAHYAEFLAGKDYRIVRRHFKD
jgi:hypothetical protein